MFSEVEHVFPQVGRAKKQTSVSHSSTESDVVSLDAGLRMDGFLALGLMGRGDRSVPRRMWSHQPNKHRETCCQIPTSNPKEEGTELLMNCQMWFTLSQTQVLLNVNLSCIYFEDNEAGDKNYH